MNIGPVAARQIDHMGMPTMLLDRMPQSGPFGFRKAFLIEDELPKLTLPLKRLAMAIVGENT